MEFVFTDIGLSKDEEAYGACAVSIRRNHLDRRFWICCPYGDTAADDGAGLWPIVSAICDDFGNLQAVQR